MVQLSSSCSKARIGGACSWYARARTNQPPEISLLKDVKIARQACMRMIFY